MIQSIADLKAFLEVKRDLEGSARASAANEDAIVAAYKQSWFPELTSPSPEGRVAARLGSPEPTGLDDFTALGRTMGTVGYGT
jgi:hypothetical protein